MIFRLFLLEGDALLPMTRMADCASIEVSILGLQYSSVQFGIFPPLFKEDLYDTDCSAKCNNLHNNLNPSVETTFNFHFPTSEFLPCFPKLAAPPR